VILPLGFLPSKCLEAQLLRKREQLTGCQQEFKEKVTKYGDVEFIK
jgi:hypothetical protein